ncbi:MAG: hypothetical protein ACKO4A_03115, partial [Gammaproteobacteria bacterium]
MRTLLVHCGSFKTGSSRIQDHAWRHRREMATLGWLYPQTGVVRNEPDVGYRHSGLVYRFPHRARWNALVDALVAEIDGAGSAQVLLSSEAWSSLPGLPSLAALIARLRRDADITDVRGVVYLRNRVDYLRSHYREFTRRRGNTLPFPAYVAQKMSSLDPVPVLARLRDLFGDSLAVFPHAGIPDAGAHLFGLLGLPYHASPEAARVNVGLDAVETEARRVLNALSTEPLAGFPGLAAIAARSGVAIDPAAWAEPLPEALFQASAPVREQFAALSAWDPAGIERFFEIPASGLADVAELTPSIRALCETWLTERRFATRFTVERLPCEAVLDAAIDRLPGGGRDSRLSGYVVPAGADPRRWRLLARV